MNRQNTQSGCRGVIGAILLIALFVLAIYGLIQGSSAIIRWVTSQTAKTDPGVVAALITGAATILGSVYIASFNANRAQERAAEEINRGRKVEIYNEFVMSLTKMLNSQKAKEGKPSERDLEFVNEFTSQIMVHGGPAVIKAYGAMQTFGATNSFGENASSQANRGIMERVETLLLEMRSELGISNKGLTKNELLGLIIIGGKPELDNML